MMRLPVRTQLALPVLFTLLALPWLRYSADSRWLTELESAQRGQLVSALDRLAPTLAAHPLLHTAGTRPSYDASRDLYAGWHRGPFVIDGRDDDWTGVPRHRYSGSAVTGSNEPWEDGSLEVEVALTANDAYLHVLFVVADDNVVFRDIRSLSTMRNDHVRLLFNAPGDKPRRYIISERDEGDVVAHVLSETTRALRRESELSGVWRNTESGYVLELRIHHALTGQQFAFEVWDVDNPNTRDLRFAVGNAATDTDSRSGRLTRRHADLDGLLAGEGFDQMHLTDEHGQILATTGPAAPGPTPDNLLEASTEVVREQGSFATLTVREASTRVHAARTAARLRLATELFFVTLIAAGLWYLISSRLAARLGAFRRRITVSVDGRGRVSPLPPGTTLEDEVSDAEQALFSAQERLARYQQHHEGAMRQLAHELRTPISVVRSSLEAMSLGGATDPSVYVDRASAGLNRLSTLLNKLTEARRLEQSLHASEVEIFDFAELVRGCLAGYEIAWPETRFELEGADAPFRMTGVPEVIAQMLDKLVANAVSFHGDATPIRLSIERAASARGAESITLTISNDGPRLGAEQPAALFDAMVSTRSGEGEHLGLGLYIARMIAEFHDGSISLRNHESGVEAVVELPGVRLTSRLLP